MIDGYLTNRTEISCAMNFNLYPIIEMNIETPEEGWDDVFTGPTLRVEYHFKGDKYNHYFTCDPEIYLNNNGESNALTDDNIMNSKYFYLTRGAIGISAEFNYFDVIQMAEHNQRVVVCPEWPVLVVFNKPSEKRVYVRLMKLSAADPFSNITCRVIPLTAEEQKIESEKISRIIKSRESL